MATLTSKEGRLSCVLEGTSPQMAKFSRIKEESQRVVALVSLTPGLEQTVGAESQLAKPPSCPPVTQGRTNLELLRTGVRGHVLEERVNVCRETIATGNTCTDGLLTSARGQGKYFTCDPYSEVE
ncbi:hypothetical protein Bbelb_179610 [Branchiostoma belcheri]|nr:hypothetical protein Bbelb_179610 [Branchiostoma belcheri]